MFRVSRYLTKTLSVFVLIAALLLTLGAASPTAVAAAANTAASSSTAAASSSIAAASSSTAAAAPKSPGDMVDGLGTAQYTTQGGATFRTSNTIPYWSSTFTDGVNGVTYPYWMVGTNPMLGPASTTVPVVIIPFDFVFTTSAAPDSTLAGSSIIDKTVSSPIFQNAPFKTGATSVGETQYSDAIQKAMFWSTGGSDPGYHVLLGQPQIAPTQVIDVPANQGQLVVGSVSHARIGLLEEGWFSNKLLSAINSMHIPANTLPLIMTYNTFLYEHSLGNCCILGYHGALSAYNGNGQQQVQTYMFAAYSDPGIFRSTYIQDIHALGHEVSEWMADPFINNAVTPWLTPTAPQYGCTGYLETGDPVVGVGFTVRLNGITYHPEDEVYFSWFAREYPSRAANGWYTWMNTFTSYAQGCQ